MPARRSSSRSTTSKPKIVVSEQVADFIRALAPAPRHKLKAGIGALPAGDIKPLQGQFLGFQRLRCSHYRVIFRETAIKGVPVYHCLFTDYRDRVYEAFAELLADDILNRLA